jgi:hypothetical protein
MVSSSTAHRHKTGDHINSIGWLAMVSCKYCAKNNLECKMSSLKKACGNCYYNGISKCEPVEVPLPNYSKLDRELARLAKQEAEADKAEEDAFNAMVAARAKKERLRKQRELLQRREQRWVDESGRYVEDLEALEAVDSINREVANLEGGLMPGTSALDWSAFSPSWLEGDPMPSDLAVGS